MTLAPFAAQPVPPVTYGPGCLAGLGDAALALAAPGPVLLAIDPAVARLPAADRAAASLAAAGFAPRLFDRVAAEPKHADLTAAVEAAAGAVLVVGIGGGSVLDVAKIAGCCAPGQDDPMRFAGCAAPLPAARLPRILVPTTAGTGAESSATCVFSDARGAKLWIWGAEARADRVLLDPELTLSLPPRLTAVSGLDAFVHAFEAATNRNAHALSRLYGLDALARIARALPRAVADGSDLDARGEMLLAACLAGTAIDQAGTAVAHALSHALGSLAPVPHGLATALALSVALPHVVAGGGEPVAAAARACGLSGAEGLPGFFDGFLAACGVAPALPGSCAGVTPEALMAELAAPQNAPMRAATLPAVGEAELERMARALLALAPAPAPAQAG